MGICERGYGHVEYFFYKKTYINIHLLIAIPTDRARIQTSPAHRGGSQSPSTQKKYLKKYIFGRSTYPDLVHVGHTHICHCSAVAAVRIGDTSNNVNKKRKLQLKTQDNSKKISSLRFVSSRLAFLPLFFILNCSYFSYAFGHVKL